MPVNSEEVQRVDVPGVLTRLRSLHGVSTDTELAAALHVSQSTVASWKQRNSIPFDVIIVQAVLHQKSLDWLVFGTGAEMLVTPAMPDLEILERAIKVALHTKLGLSAKVGSGVVAEASSVYREFAVLFEAYRTGFGLSRAEALKFLDPLIEIKMSAGPEGAYSKTQDRLPE